MMRTLKVLSLIIIALSLQACPDGLPQSLQQTTGLVSIESSGDSRQFYIKRPDNYDPTGPDMPVVFAYHGTGGTYELFLDGFYDLADAIGNGAILVLMQAKPDPNVGYQWDFDVDFQYFEDVLAILKKSMPIDENRVFVTGHSSGGGMAHELGCNYGDVIRAIAPHAGILKSSSCIGSVAVLQTHGLNDTLVPWGTGEAGHQFWTLYNGFTAGLSDRGIHPTCIDHSLGGLDFPVQWCLHEEGTGVDAHDWASFASRATWQFFSNLRNIAPNPFPPPGGGNGNLGALIDTTFSFTLHYPDGIGDITEGAISLYEAGTQQPVFGGPQAIINGGFDPGNVGPGSTMSYKLPIKYVAETFPGTYAFSIVIYVADGGNPIPQSGKDHLVFYDVMVTDRNNPVVIDDVLTMEPVF
jgi:predicted esterase